MFLRLLRSLQRYLKWAYSCCSIFLIDCQMARLRTSLWYYSITQLSDFKCGTNNGGDRPLSNERVMHVWE